VIIETQQQEDSSLFRDPKDAIELPSAIQTIARQPLTGVLDPERPRCHPQPREILAH
jgi:hypothetical protein